MKDAEPSVDATDRDEDGAGLASGLRALLVGLFRLVMVEARLCGYTALAMIGLCVATALLAVASWLFAGAALVMALAGLPAFSLAGALLTVALSHLGLAVLIFCRLRRIARDLTFRESRASVHQIASRLRSPMDHPTQRARQE